MKKYLLTMLLISINCSLLTVNCLAQAPDWLWAKRAGGIYYDGGQSVSIDNGGNIYVTGGFCSSSINFGAYTLTNASVSCDFFLVKYDAIGNVLWAKSAGGAGDENGYSVSTDNAGNVYVTGYFKSPSISFGSYTLLNAGTNSFDIFLVKYDANGNVLWAKSAGGASDDVGHSVFANSGGNVYVTGSSSSPSISFGSDTLTNAGLDDIFLVKYDANGNELWAKRTGGSGGEIGYGVSSDSGGNVYITGYFGSQSLIFGSYTLLNAGANGLDIFLAKYDANGNVLWAKSAGTAYYFDFAYFVTTDSGGNVYVAGYFDSPSISFGSYTLTNAGVGDSDIFLVKYDANGNVLWAKSAGGALKDIACSISTDNGGNVYVTGFFGSPSISFGSYTYTNAGVFDIFLVKYDASGNVLWAKSAGGADYDVGLSVSADSAGNGYITGYFDSPSISFGSDTLTNAGARNIFVTKINGVVGIEEISRNNTCVNIFPNPFTTSSTLQVSKSLQSATLVIYDIIGKEVKRMEGLSGKEIIIQRESMKSGMYFYLLMDKQGVVGNGKMVVE